MKELQYLYRVLTARHLLNQENKIIPIRYKKLVTEPYINNLCRHFGLLDGAAFPVEKLGIKHTEPVKPADVCPKCGKTPCECEAEPVKPVETVVETPVEEIVDETPAEAPVPEAVVETVTEEPVVETVVEPVDETPAEAPVPEAVVETTDEEHAVEEPVVETVDEQPVVETVTEEPATEVVEEAPKKKSTRKSTKKK